MQWRSTERDWGAIYKLLHWVIAALVLTMIGLGWVMTEALEDDVVRKFQLYQLHKSIGMTVLALILVRLAWRLGNRVPDPPTSMPAYERWLARSTHWLFYGLLVAMPVSGWMMVSAAPINIPTVVFGLIPIPHPLVPDEALFERLETLHETLSLVLVALIVLHVLAAMKHHFISRDAVLRRMLPGVSVFVILLWPAMGSAATWEIDSADSAIEIKGLLFGSEWQGRFGSFSGSIAFEPGERPDGSVSVTVDMASFSTGARNIDERAPTVHWFHIDAFPSAVFRADTFRRQGDGRYQAEGTLTIRDRTVPLVLPFLLRIEGDRAEMTASVRLDRLDFDLGLGDSDGNKVVDPLVDVDIRVRAVRTGP